jgi:filamentous hemagglutinin family protein
MRVNEVSRRVRLTQKSPFFSWRLVALTLGCFSVVSNYTTQAQIVPDNTVGSQVERVNATRDRITGGTTRGSNLFHSFREFSIQEGRAAYFANPAAIKTIFSRVTGNNPSQIFGTLGVDGNANLFFINPNGIIFGANATLDVRGSFIASTANRIAFPNGENFSATNPNAPPLLTIDVPVPIGLVFESDNTGIIVNNANLQTRQNLALIGAGIRSSGRIFAPGGDITLATVPGAVDSIVGLDGTEKFLGTIRGNGQPNLTNRDIVLIGGAIDATSTGKAGNVILNSAGNVQLTNNATVNVRGATAGKITVNAQNLELSGGSVFAAGISSGLGSPRAQAGNVTLKVANEINLSQSSAIENRVNENALGNAGEINVRAGALNLTQGSYLSASTLGRGNGGNITVEVDGAVKLDGKVNNDSISRISNVIGESAVGNGGNI